MLLSGGMGGFGASPLASLGQIFGGGAGGGGGGGVASTMSYGGQSWPMYA
jgi:hypothetical protein